MGQNRLTLQATLCRLTGLQKEKLKPAFYAGLYLFCILAGYYIIQPLRDDIGLLLGKDFIPKLFIWSLLVMALANPSVSYTHLTLPTTPYV